VRHNELISTPSLLEETLPVLDLDHPGASDPAYRARRLHIAQLARAFRDDPTGPVPRVEYTEQEHAVWRQVCAVLGDLHEHRACRAYRRGRVQLNIPTDHIPQLGDVSERLATTAGGFRLWPVEGLVLPRIFLTHLEQGVMHATQYLRHPSRPFFTPEPDIIHELLGHAPLFADADFAAFSRLIGQAARLADDEQLEHMSRLYWFTVEFGLIEEDGGVRAFGAGLLGGVEDLERAFSDAAEVKPFDLAEVIETSYDYEHPQPTYFVIPSFAALRQEMEQFIGRWLDPSGAPRRPLLSG
jgi:phenylalanine-4-hydroxylase